MQHVSGKQVDIPYKHLKKLESAGKVKLGISQSLATQISTQGRVPDGSTAAKAFTFWNFVSLVCLGGGIILAFSIAWWWVLVGVIGSYVIAKANRSGNSENIVDLGLQDANYYEQIRAIDGWVYQIDENEFPNFERKT